MLTPFEERALRCLSPHPFFEALGASRMRGVRRTALRRGETLFAKGDASDRLYGLVSGQIKLFSAGADGRRVSLEIVGPGELLGSVEMADGLPHHANALALAHCELAVLSRRVLEPLMVDNPQLRIALMGAAADAARRLMRRLEDAALLDIEARVERALVDLAGRIGERIERGTRIRLRQRDLADVLGLSRESVSRVLTSPAMRDKLELGRGSIVLIGV